MEVPEAYFVRHNIVCNIEIHPLDFIVSVSIYGDVIQVETPFFELPEYAQRLILGSDYEKIITKIVRYAELLRYRVPLAIYDFLRDEELIELVKEVKQRRKNLKISDSILEEKYHVTDKWTNDVVWIVHEIKNKINLESKRVLMLENIGILLSADTSKHTLALSQINQFRFQAAAPIIRCMIDDMAELTKNYAYPALANFRSEENKQFFIKQFKKKENDKWRHHIISGLFFYKDQAVYDMIMKYYHNNKNIPETTLRNIYIFFKQFETKEVEKIGWEGLLGNKVYAGEAARELIFSLNIPEEKIAIKINAVFHNLEKMTHLPNLIAHYNWIKNVELIPSTEDILAAVERGLSQNINLSHRVAGILMKKYNPSVPKKLYQMLFSDLKEVRGSAIYIMLNFMMSLDRIDFQISDDLIERLKTLTSDNFPNNQNQAIQLLGKLSTIKQIGGLIPLFLNKINLLSPQKNTISMIAMQSINDFFQHHPFNETVIPIYLEGLRHTNDSIKIAALKGLQYFLTGKIKAQIYSLKNDKNPEIRKLVNTFYNMPTIVKKLQDIPKETPKHQKKQESIKQRIATLEKFKARNEKVFSKKDYLFSRVLNFLKKYF